MPSRWRRTSRTRRHVAPGSPSWWSVVARPGSRSRARSRSWPARASQGNFRRIDPADAEILLVDGGKEILATFGDRLSAKAAAELRRLGVTIRSRSIVTDVDPFGVDVRDRGRDDRADRLPDEDLGRRRAGLAAGRAARRGRRGHVRPCRSHRRERRLHASRPPRGLRDRRHDGAARPSRRRRGGDAVGHPRRQHDQAPAARRGGGDVHLPRPRQHGHHLPVPRRGQLQEAPAVRLPRLADVAPGAHHLPDRLPEPALRDVPLDRDVRGGRTRRTHDHGAPDGRSGRPRAGRRGRHRSSGPAVRAADAAGDAAPDDGRDRRDDRGPDERPPSPSTRCRGLGRRWRSRWPSTSSWCRWGCRGR